VINRLRELLQIERCFGIDISQTFLSFGKKNYPNIKFIQYDKFILPFVDHSLDLIILSDIIEHIHDLSLFFKEVKRVAKYGLLKVPLDRYLWRKLVSEPLRRSPSVGSSHPDGHIHEFWKKSFEGMLKDAGFNILGSKVIYEEINQPNYHLTSGILKIRWYLDFKFKRLLPKLAHIIFGGQLFVFIST